MVKGERNNYGVVKQVVNMCAQDLCAELSKLNSKAELLEAGHQRYKLIDNQMTHGMGKDVRRYWMGQTETYRSLLRRKVWELALKGLDNAAPKK